MDKINYFTKELSYIKDSNRRSDLEHLINELPDYFFKVPASSTGKYHPDFAQGEGGLVRHTKVAVRIAYELLNNNTVGIKFTPKDKDLILIALTLHDGLKLGQPEEKYTRFDHPLLASQFIQEHSKELSMDTEDVKKICSMIESHMGEWTYDSYNQKEVLPKPKTAEQRFVHLCDFLASKKFIDVKFDGVNIKY